jgi:hypothetical protein
LIPRLTVVIDLDLSSVDVIDADDERPLEHIVSDEVQSWVDSLGWDAEISLMPRLEPLEVAEAHFDAVLQNPVATSAEKDAAARRFFRRAYQSPDDGERAYQAWVLHHTCPAHGDA